MDLRNVKTITIPEGVVTKITSPQGVIWQKKAAFNAKIYTLWTPTSSTWETNLLYNGISLNQNNQIVGCNIGDKILTFRSYIQAYDYDGSTFIRTTIQYSPIEYTINNAAIIATNPDSSSGGQVLSAPDVIPVNMTGEISTSKSSYKKWDTSVSITGTSTSYYYLTYADRYSTVPYQMVIPKVNNITLVFAIKRKSGDYSSNFAVYLNGTNKSGSISNTYRLVIPNATTVNSIDINYATNGYVYVTTT